jgi:Flp pilus assembly pilin Flp
MYWDGRASFIAGPFVSLSSGLEGDAGENKPMKKLCVRLFREEQGQDLIEYTLLLAFVCLAAAALFIPTGRTIASIFSITSKSLSQAASAASN